MIPRVRVRVSAACRRILLAYSMMSADESRTVPILLAQGLGDGTDPFAKGGAPMTASPA
jgi:hypothetical protein